MLQLGGVHEAVTSAPPRLACALAVLIPVEFERVEKDRTSGWLLLQVRGGLVRVNPRVSTAVAWNVMPLPLPTVIEFPLRPCGRMRTYCTRQVIIGWGLLVGPEIAGRTQFLR